MSFEVPAGLTELLQEFTVAVLREKPSDLVPFAAGYFSELQEQQSGGVLPGLGDFKAKSGKGVAFANGDNSESDEDYDMEPPSKEALMRRTSVSAERYDPEDDEDEDEPKVVHPKSDEQRRRLNDAVKNILLFKSLDYEQMSEVIDAMFERQTSEGDCIIKEGDDGDNFYIIQSGVYDIYKRQANGTDRKVGDYNGSGSFGELALMYNQPRAATIITADPGNIWALDRTTFRRIVLKNAFMKRKMYENLIESVPLFKELTLYERMNLADALSTRSFVDGDLIIQQGDSADGMFFIESGEVKVIMRTHEDDAPKSDEEAEVNRLGSGKYFGELALLTSKPRAASVFAVGAAKCAFVDVDAFERLLGPCTDIMGRNISEYEKQLESAFGHKVDITELR